MTPPDAASGTDERARQLRTQLVTDLVANGSLRRGPWQKAFLTVPRHVFVPRFFRTELVDGQPRQVTVDGSLAADRDDWLTSVYSDIPLLTGAANRAVTSSSSMPSLMAAMLEALDPQDGDTVTEIGTGTGYNAALLSERLGDNAVTTIDVDPALTASAIAHSTLPATTRASSPATPPTGGTANPATALSPPAASPTSQPDGSTESGQADRSSSPSAPG